MACIYSMKRMFGVLMVLLALAGVSACATVSGGFRVQVLVDGNPVPEYVAHGTRYIEAIKGKEYAIRLHNPLGVRVAVALSVDGLNTIDARRTDARSAQKWVLAPYETITISGWQTNMSQARRFYFTSEEQSYANWLGKTDNLGIVTAVFFRERMPPPSPQPTITPGAPHRSGEEPRAQSRDEMGRESRADSSRSAAGMKAPSPSPEEYAATGIGQRMDHQVERIHLDLEDRPAATVNIRYEYRAQLVRLGIFPPSPPYPDSLARRQHARGFEPGFCPEPR